MEFDDMKDEVNGSIIEDAIIEEAIKRILNAVGEDPQREGLQFTPRRVARMYHELLGGYTVDADALINDALFNVQYDEMVLVRDIEFFSLCEHHMLPFMGRVHVAYIPDGKVLGLSKIPRIVDMYARRLQVQERMTTSAMHGAFRANLATREEFLANISRGSSPLQI